MPAAGGKLRHCHGKHWQEATQHKINVPQACLMVSVSPALHYHHPQQGCLSILAMDLPTTSRYFASLRKSFLTIKSVFSNKTGVQRKIRSFIQSILSMVRSKERQKCECDQSISSQLCLAGLFVILAESFLREPNQYQSLRYKMPKKTFIIFSGHDKLMK